LSVRRLPMPVTRLVAPSINAHAANSPTSTAMPRPGAKKASTPKAIASSPRMMKVHHHRASWTVPAMSRLTATVSSSCESDHPCRSRAGRRELGDAARLRMRGGDGIEQPLRCGRYICDGFFEGMLVGR
jgi:hypothetical protein